jgi:Concanavalin A-like lectin/glucanases superfamily
LPPALAQIPIHVNQAPVISVSADTIITLPANGTLSGEVVDLGLADPNGAVTRTWAQVSGPDEVIFADARAVTTTARFTQSGVYVVKLTVETGGDGYHLQNEGEVTVVANQSPEGDGGVDQTITLPALVELEGTVNFIDYRSPYTQARFSQSGIYVLRLEAQDYADSVPVSDDVTIEVKPSPRVIEGLQTLFTFTETQGACVHDVAGSGAPVDLVLEDPSGSPEPITWLNPGLRLNTPVILKAAAATQLIRKIKDTNEITIEAWVKRAATVLEDQQPGRIVTMSVDPSRRNFTLGQTSNEKFQIRLRTTLTNDNGINLRNTQQSIVQTVETPPNLCHLVFTREADGDIRFYLNGADPLGSERSKLGGTFHNWGPASDYRLAVGNELTNNRPWLGEVFLIAIYNRALSANEVQQNFGAGFGF